jgi:hypothetical protein
MGSGLVVVVSADERWLRVLDVTIRLGGASTIKRRSVVDALQLPIDEAEHPTALVVDLAAQSTEKELDNVRHVVQENSLPAVVILPERLAAERERFAAVGATVLVRPYRPSELYAALWPGESAGADGTDAVDEPLIVDEPLTVGPEPAAEPATGLADDPPPQTTPSGQTAPRKDEVNP